LPVSTGIETLSSMRIVRALLGRLNCMRMSTKKLSCPNTDETGNNRLESVKARAMLSFPLLS
jgi:hypothetical protein